MFEGREMAALKSLETLLQDSGWTVALVQAGIASPRMTGSFLTASRITRTQQMHQVTACNLYQPLTAAYTDYSNDTAENTEGVLSFKAWCESQKIQSPQFQFWHLVLSTDWHTL